MISSTEGHQSTEGAQWWDTWGNSHCQPLLFSPTFRTFTSRHPPSCSGRNSSRLFTPTTPPPPIKFGPGGFMRLSRVILVENPDSLTLAHMKGHEGNLLGGIQI
jgi:hypothetical protein